MAATSSSLRCKLRAEGERVVVVFRCTQKVLARLRMRPAADPPRSTGRLGDWYIGHVFVHRRPLLLFVSERTRLPVVVPVSPPNLVPARFKIALGRMLASLGVDAQIASQELLSVDDVIVAKTQSRSLLGTINDFTLAIRFATYDRRPTETYNELALWLAETPIRPLNDCPEDATRRLLAGTVH